MSAVAGLVVTLGLFYFMATLITRASEMPRSDDTENFIEFVRIKPETKANVRKRELPKKPPPRNKPPPPSRLKLAQKQTNVKQDLDINAPKMDMPLAAGDGPFIGQGSAGAQSQNDEVLPLFRIEPRYPRKAAMSKTEGWVILQFDITEMGSVENVQVLDAKPRRVFDKAARKALLKWKYKPKIVDGKPKPQVGNKVKLDFKLQD